MLVDDALMVNKGALNALEVGRHVRLQYGMAVTIPPLIPTMSPFPTHHETRGR